MISRIMVVFCRRVNLSGSLIGGVLPFLIIIILFFHQVFLAAYIHRKAFLLITILVIEYSSRYALDLTFIIYLCVLNATLKLTLLGADNIGGTQDTELFIC